MTNVVNTWVQRMGKKYSIFVMISIMVFSTVFFKKEYGQIHNILAFTEQV